ncbi:unnamed protein product [Clonostachys solani]|uniref:Uncharacterized protein n=1 Tax=Clonostachys solani TaxID=160281 RepID=A0A9N9ZGD8_9HYPO|nr:unnamed protein product [Clonostachys solani]
MADYSLYDATVPHAISALNAILSLLDMLQAHASTANVPVENYINARLISNMYPFNFQVFMVCRMAKDIIGHCQGAEDVAKNFGSEEEKQLAELTTLERMNTLVRAALDVVNNSDRNKFTGRAGATITFNFGPDKYITSTVSQFIGGYGLPNMYFHLVTAYDIVRSKGVPVGKQDLLTPFFNQQQISP